MDAVTACAIGHRLRPGLGRQPVEGGVEAHHAVRRQAELARQADIAVAASAGFPDVRRVHRRGFVAGFDDFVFAVAIGAERGLVDSARHRLSVYALPVLLRHLAVAHPAGIRDAFAKSFRAGGQQFVGAAVANAAIGRAVVARLASQAVYALGVVAGLVRVARAADGLGNVRGVGILFVRLVAGIAGQTRVCALCQFLPLVVARSTLRRRRCLRCLEIGAGCPEYQTQ